MYIAPSKPIKHSYKPVNTVASITTHKSVVRHKTSKINRQLCIGIITIPHIHGASHIMKCYVNWFEERGIRVLPIPYDTKDHEVYFQLVHGLLIPGGDMEFIMQHKMFIRTVTWFFERSLSEYFPIWGTCFGFELLLFLVGGFTSLNKYNAQGLYPITIVRESRMMREFSPRVLQYLEGSKSTHHNHAFGLSPEEFMKNLHLQRFYNIVATAKTDNDITYIAAFEAKYYPVYGVQFHPERLKKTGVFADFFISELNKSKHRCKISIPHIGTYRHVDKCSQYREAKKMACYLF